MFVYIRAVIAVSQAIPRLEPIIAHLSATNPEKRFLYPWPLAPRTFSLGILTELKIVCPISTRGTDWMPSLLVSKPSKPRSTITWYIVPRGFDVSDTP